jgi:DNA primase
MEGRSTLVKRTQSPMKQLPEGVFKQMMFSRLQTLSELPKQQLMQLSALSSPLFPPKKIKGLQKKGKFSLVRYTITLLLQNPELSTVFINNTVIWRHFIFPGSDVLKEVLHTISHQKPTTMGELLEYYRDTTHEKIIYTLAGYDLNLDGASNEIIEKIFVDSLHNLIKKAKETILNELLIKGSQQQLNEKEKKILLKMLGKTTIPVN